MQGYEVQQNSAAYPLVFLLVLSSDHITGATGLTPTVTLSKNGGAFASPAGAVSAIGNGWYQVAGNATDTGTLGPIILHASVATADPTDVVFPVVAVNPQSTAYGLSLAKTTNITGFNDIAATAIVSAGAITTAGGAVSTVTTVTNAGADTSGTTTLLARLTTGRASNLDNLDAAISTRSTYAGADTSGTTTLLGRLTTGRAGNLDTLDAAVSTRSTYAGGDTSGTTTLLTRLTTGRASNLDNLDAAVSTRSTYAGGAVASGNVGGSVASVTAPVTVGANSDKTGYALGATGLDAISTTAPTTMSGVTFRQMVVMVFRRFFKASAKSESALTITNFADDGTTPIGTQPFTDDGAGTETLGPSS
jgi:hypothetical protein